MKFSVEKIGPEEAAAYLAQNTHNRKIKPHVVDKYAAAMTRGEWALNGEAIKFDVDGGLLDGQHRLAAIIASGVTIETIVIRGLVPESQDTLDHHTPRTLGDVLALHGEKNATDLAAALSVFWRVERGAESQSIAPSPQQALDLLAQHPGIRESVLVGLRVSRIGVSRGMSAAMHYIFATIDADDAEFFFERLADGVDLTPTSPIYVYREWCLTNLRNQHNAIGRRISRPRVQALMVKAWNAYREGVEMKQLRWAVGGAHPEPFPKAA